MRNEVANHSGLWYDPSMDNCRTEEQVSTEKLSVRLWHTIKYSGPLRWWYSGRRQAAGRVHRRVPGLEKALRQRGFGPKLEWVSSLRSRLLLLCLGASVLSLVVAQACSGLVPLPDWWPQQATLLSLLLAFVGLTVSVMVFAVPHRQMQIEKLGREDSTITLREGWLVMMGLALAGVLATLASPLLNSDGSATFRGIWLVALAMLSLWVLGALQRFILDMGPAHLRKLLVDVDVARFARDVELRLINVELSGLLRGSVHSGVMRTSEVASSYESGALQLEPGEVIADLDLRAIPELSELIRGGATSINGTTHQIVITDHLIGCTGSWASPLKVPEGAAAEAGVVRMNALKRAHAIHVVKQLESVRDPLEVRLAVVNENLTEGRFSLLGTNLDLLRKYLDRVLSLSAQVRGSDPNYIDKLDHIPFCGLRVSDELWSLAHSVAHASELTRQEVFHTFGSICTIAIRHRNKHIFQHFYRSIRWMYSQPADNPSSAAFDWPKSVRDLLSTWWGWLTVGDSNPMLTEELDSIARSEMLTILQAETMQGIKHAIERSDFQTPSILLEQLWSLANAKAYHRATGGDANDSHDVLLNNIYHSRLVEMVVITLGWALHLSDLGKGESKAPLAAQSLSKLCDKLMQLEPSVGDLLASICELTRQRMGNDRSPTNWGLARWFTPDFDRPTGRAYSLPEPTWAIRGGLVLAISLLGERSCLDTGQIGNLSPYHLEQVMQDLSEMREADGARVFLDISGDEWNRRIGVIETALRDYAILCASQRHNDLITAAISPLRLKAICAEWNEYYKNGFEVLNLFGPMTVDSEEGTDALTIAFWLHLDKENLTSMPVGTSHRDLDPRVVEPCRWDHEAVGSKLASAATVVDVAPRNGLEVASAVDEAILAVRAAGGKPVVILFGREAVVSWLTLDRSSSPAQQPHRSRLQIGAISEASVLLWSCQQKPYILVGSTTSVGFQYNEPIWTISSVENLDVAPSGDPLRPTEPQVIVNLVSSLRMRLDPAAPFRRIPLHAHRLGFGAGQFSSIYHRPGCHLLPAVPQWFLTESDCVQWIWLHSSGRPAPCPVCIGSSEP